MVDSPNTELWMRRTGRPAMLGDVIPGGTTHRPEVVLMCGLAGSGKTTYAEHLVAKGYVRLSIDEELWNSYGRYGVDYPADRYAELSEIVERRLRRRLATLVGGGSDVVVDFAFWRRADRERYKALVEAAGGRWRLVYLDVPADELRRRLAHRADRFDANAAFAVDARLFEHYRAAFEEPAGEGEEVVDWTAAPGPS
jgi:predicted kinase